MKLYYTGASEHLGKQALPAKSLGGYISSSEIPNDFMNNLFPDISNRSLEQQYNETRMIVLYNNDIADYTDILIHFDYPVDATSKLLIAAVIPTLDSCDNPIFEIIQSPYSKPYVGTFVEADDIANQVNLGNLSVGGYLGIWIRREIEFNSENFLKNKNCQGLDDIKTGASSAPSTQEKIAMVINYT